MKFVREVDTMISVIFRPNGVPFHNQQVEPLAMLNMDCHGNLSTFSPELLGYKDRHTTTSSLATSTRTAMEQIRDSRWLAAMQRDIDAGVAMCRANCEYFSICGGGAPMNKLTENGSFNSSKTVFCSLIQMAAADVVLASARELQRTWQPETAEV